MEHYQTKLETLNPTRDVLKLPLLSVIVPIFNEQETLLRLISQVAEESTDKEIILVDDGSSDKTSETIAIWLQTEKLLPQHIARIVWLEHRKNMGKGTAIRSGLNVASGEYVVVQDADLEVSPTDYPQLIEPLVRNQAEFVIGSRVYPNRNALSAHRLGVQLLNCMVWLLYGYKLSDSACCFKVLKRTDVLDMALQCRRFEFCPEIISKASHMGLKVKEVEVSYFPRTVVDGKKLHLLRDGIHALITLLRFCFWRPLNRPSLKVSEDQPQSFS